MNQDNREWRRSQPGPRAKCNNCGDIIQSMSVHDRKGCTCWFESDEKIYACFDEIDKSLEERKYIMDEWERHMILCVLNTHFSTGFTIDGGGDYLHMSGSGYTWIDKPEGGNGD